jgi:hypothetical protein
MDMELRARIESAHALEPFECSEPEIDDERDLSVD